MGSSTNEKCNGYHSKFGMNISIAGNRILVLSQSLRYMRNNLFSASKLAHWTFYNLENGREHEMQLASIVIKVNVIVFLSVQFTGCCCC